MHNYRRTSCWLSDEWKKRKWEWWGWSVKEEEEGWWYEKRLQREQASLSTLSTLSFPCMGVCALRQALVVVSGSPTQIWLSFRLQHITASGGYFPIRWVPFAVFPFRCLSLVSICKDTKISHNFLSVIWGSENTFCSSKAILCSA